MKTEYISLTQAIEIFEEHKITYMCNLDKTLVNQTQHCQYESGMVMNESYINITTDFIFHVINLKIPLYSATNRDFSYQKIPDAVANNIEYFPPDISSLLSTCAFKYEVCNNYDYKQTYNPSTNYDVLKNTATNEIEYFHLSIKSSEFAEFMRKIKEE